MLKINEEKLNRTVSNIIDEIVNSSYGANTTGFIVYYDPETGDTTLPKYASQDIDYIMITIDSGLRYLEFDELTPDVEGWDKHFAEVVEDVIYKDIKREINNIQSIPAEQNTRNTENTKVINEEALQTLVYDILDDCIATSNTEKDKELIFFWNPKDGDVKHISKMKYEDYTTHRLVRINTANYYLSYGNKYPEGHWVNKYNWISDWGDAVESVVYEDISNAINNL